MSILAIIVGACCFALGLAVRKESPPLAILSMAGGVALLFLEWVVTHP